MTHRDSFPIFRDRLRDCMRASEFWEEMTDLGLQRANEVNETATTMCAVSKNVQRYQIIDKIPEYKIGIFGNFLD